MGVTTITLFVGIIGAIIALFFFVGHVSMRKLAKQVANAEANLQQYGIITEGSIVSHVPHILFFVYSLAYSYRHAGKKYQAKQHVLKKDYFALKDGIPVTVKYVSEKPEVATIMNYPKVVTAHYYSLLSKNYIYIAVIFSIVSLSCFIKIFFIH